MKECRAKIGFNCAHVELAVIQNGKFTLIGNVQGHDAHRALVTIGWRPAPAYQQDAEQKSKCEYCADIEPVSIDFEVVHIKCNRLVFVSLQCRDYTTNVNRSVLRFPSPVAYFTLIFCTTSYTTLLYHDIIGTRKKYAQGRRVGERRRIIFCACRSVHLSEVTLPYAQASQGGI